MPTPSNKKKVPCTECGKLLVGTSGNISAHMRTQHGIYQRGTNKTASNPAIKGFKRVEGFVLLEDSSGGLWLAEQLK